MKKTTNIPADKSRTIHQLRKIKFDLNPLNYKCFISISQKLDDRGDVASPEHVYGDNLTCFVSPTENKGIKDLRIPYIRRGSQLTQCGYSDQFNTQVLLMQYEKDQVYTDSIKKGSEKQAQMDSKSANSQTSEQNQIVKSCLKMLSEQTAPDVPSPPRLTPVPLSQCYPNIANYHTGYRSNNSDLSSFAIDLSKIQLDGRTTIMIRNIPNKYTQSLLLELFNKNHNKKMDFFYLPIDYKNNCNVGYAFLNFIDSKFIEDFYVQFHNKKWKLFNSQKICHICYARIQGASQLSHHFDSSRRL